MSREAIAAVLTRDDLVSGERLVALSLASFADRENRAWPGTPAAAARAGLCRSRYLQAREQLVARGLVVVEERATGRGRATTVMLAFADAGPWWDGGINVELCEAVLGYSSARGPARLLIATMAAVSDEDGTVRDVATEQLCAVAGVADRTYRRARMSLLESGELVLVSGVDGRGNTNVWRIADPRLLAGAGAYRVPRRVAPPAGARPLLAAAGTSRADTSRVDVTSTHDEKGGQVRTVDSAKCPTLTGVSALKGGHDRTVLTQDRPALTGVSVPKGGQAQTLCEPPLAETAREGAAETPAETPAPNARAGRESFNPRTPEDPPNPPAGGSPPDSMLIEQTYVTERGRRRRRAVRIDLAEVRRGLRLPGSRDHADWQRVRALLFDAVGENTFAIWLEPLELIAIGVDGALVIAAPPALAGWVSSRYGPLLSARAESAGRQLRFAVEADRAAVGSSPERQPGRRALQSKQQEVS